MYKSSGYLQLLIAAFMACLVNCLVCQCSTTCDKQHERTDSSTKKQAFGSLLCACISTQCVYVNYYTANSGRPTIHCI